MANYYIDNRKLNGLPYVQYHHDGCSIDVSDNKKIICTSGQFSQVEVGDPFWITSNGLNNSATIGVYLVNTVDVSSGNFVILNRAVGNTGETDISVAHTPYDGSVTAEHIDGVMGPYPTIQYALDHASVNEHIYVRSNNGYVFDNIDQPLAEGVNYALCINRFGGTIETGQIGHLCGYDQEPGDGGIVLLDGHDQSRMIMKVTTPARNIHFENIHISNTNSQQINTEAWHIDQVKNCMFTHCKASDTRQAILATGDCRSFIIRQCEFYDLQDLGIAAYSSFTGDILIHGSSIHHCENNYSIATFDGARITIIDSLLHHNLGHCLCSGTGSRINIINCTIDQANHIGIVTNTNEASIYLLNCLITNSNQNNIYADGGTIRGDYCCSYNGGNEDTWYEGKDCISIDPMFMDATQYDYCPKRSFLMESGSPTLQQTNNTIGAYGMRYVKGESNHIVCGDGTITGGF